MVQFYFISGK